MTHASPSTVDPMVPDDGAGLRRVGLAMAPRGRSAASRLRRDPRATIGVAVVVLLTLAAILAPLRQPDGRFHISFERVPVNPTGDKERDIDAIVAEYTRVLERWVRRTPEQYFWHHRRWKHRPPEDAATAAGTEEPA